MEGEQERLRVGEELSPVGQAFLPVAFSQLALKSAACGEQCVCPETHP